MATLLSLMDILIFLIHMGFSGPVFINFLRLAVMVFDGVPFHVNVGYTICESSHNLGEHAL